MAKLSSILFNRTMSQFLDCKDLDGKKGKELTDKIRNASPHFLDKILEAFPNSGSAHRKVLTSICRENYENKSSDFFLDTLVHDDTQFRISASEILTQVEDINSERLFRRLHQSGTSKTELINTLASHSKKLKPDDIINNAIRLDPADGISLIKLAEKSEIEIDLSKLSFQVDKINDATFKASLVRYLGLVNQVSVVGLITRFLNDSSNLVKLEALKSLNRLNFRYDVSVLLPFILNMNEVEQKLALEIAEKQADAALIFHIPEHFSSKSTLINESLIKIVADHANLENLPKFLSQLEKQDNWTRTQVIENLQKLAHEKLTQVARNLNAHDDEFIRSSAQKISGYELDIDDLEKIGEFALNDNWQVRQRAIQTLGKSSNVDAIGILTEVLNQWPDTASSILVAVRQLGFSRGLKIALKCLNHSEASIQRSALETIASVVNEKHALNVRDKIVNQLPKMNLELTEVAKTIARDLTMKFKLPAIDLNDEPSKVDKTPISLKPKPRMPALKPGTSWMDRYLVRQIIGQGAMGQVVLVEDEMMDEMLILKFMHPELTIDKASVERFKREVKYARRVGHPNVVRVHDLILQDSICAISMEYFKSHGLEKKLGQSEGLKILYQISDGMAAAHEQAVIHRDLKPSNILINDTGHVKIADFGIASASSGAEQTLTQTGAIIGSPAYLAPERATEMEADNRSDIYSLGVIAYYMISGELPYVGTAMDVLIQHREGKAKPVNEVNPAASAEIAGFIGKMMAVNPDKRPQTMIEVRDEIKNLLNSLKEVL